MSCQQLSLCVYVCLTLYILTLSSYSTFLSSLCSFYFPHFSFCPLLAILLLFSFSFSLFRSLLRSNEVQRDPRQYEQVVQKVIAYMTLGVDVSGLFSEMIMVRSD